MNEFVLVLQDERSRLTPIAETRALPAAIERRQKAHDDLQAFMVARGTGGGSSTPRERELRDAVTVANQAVADLEQQKERAAARIKEINRLLTAETDKTRARAALAKLNAGIGSARSRIAQLDQIAATLEGEAAELTRKRATAVEQYGRDELAARLAGKSAAPPKSLAALDADLESRSAALAAAQAAKAEIEAPLADLLAQAKDARNELRDALLRCAEADYYEQFASLAPVIARLVIFQSTLCGHGGSGTFTIRCGGATLREAEAALGCELNAVAGG